MVTPLRVKVSCPECGKLSVRETYPFCSPHCKAVDLNHWLSGRFAIPVHDDEEKYSIGNYDTGEER